MRLSVRRRRTQEKARLGELKLRAIDVAFQRFACRSSADLGAVWGVDAGYSLYVADNYAPERVVICDDDFTDPIVERARRDERIELIEGNFGTDEIAAQVGAVDALLMFDILLHQVDPDWDALLAMYAPRTRCFVLAGPWWRGESTVRLLDLGRDEYLETVPLREVHEPVMDKLQEFNDRRGRLWRDVHDIWQWGIADQHLRQRMRGLGFVLAHHENLGRWRGLDRFDNSAYVFVREELL
jgi:hypothetical protein